MSSLAANTSYFFTNFNTILKANYFCQFEVFKDKNIFFFKKALISKVLIFFFLK